MKLVNKRSRKRVTELVTDGEVGRTELSGDFSSEGVLDYFRRAEIWIPTDVYADFVVREDLDWYAMQFDVAFVPPEGEKVSLAGIKVEFGEVVQKLDAWLPNDVFASYRTTTESTELKAAIKLAVPEALLGQLPYLRDLLPQLSASYRRFSHQAKTPMESLIRAYSDGQRRLGYELLQDPQTGVDQRQLTASVLFGVARESGLPQGEPLMRLSIQCRCGPLHLRTEIVQDVDASLRHGP